jgi:hypothetical protein
MSEFLKEIFEAVQNGAALLPAIDSDNQKGDVQSLPMSGSCLSA